MPKHAHTQALRGATTAAAVAPATTEGSGAVINADGSATFTFPGVSVPTAEAGAADGAVTVAPATPSNKQAFAGEEEHEPRDVDKVVNADGSSTFTFPSVGVAVTTTTTAATVTEVAKQAIAGEEDTRNDGANDNKVRKKKEGRVICLPPASLVSAACRRCWSLGGTQTRIHTQSAT